jgi:hypothetical protein
VIAMNITHNPKRILTAALLSGGVAIAALATGTAQADTGLAPQAHSPYATDNFSQPHQWCPGQSLPTDDVHWDNNVCHTWFWVPVGGMGNVGQFVWDGATPPPHGPPPCYGAPICLPGL